MLEEDPDDAKRQSALAAVLNNLSQLHARQKDYQQSVTLAREAIIHGEQARKSDMEDAIHIDHLESHYFNLALGLRHLKEYEAAMEAYTQAATLAKQLVERNPTQAENHSGLGGIYHNMSQIASMMQDAGRAESLARDAIREREIARDKSPDNVAVLSNLRQHYILLSSVLRANDRFAEATEALSNAISIAEQVAKLSQDPDSQDTLASLLCDLARDLADPRSGTLRDESRSVKLVERAREIAPESRAIPYTRGVIEVSKGNWTVALEHLSKVLDDDKLTDDRRAFTYAYTALAHAHTGDLERARDCLQKARDMWNTVDETEARVPSSARTKLVQDVEGLLQPGPEAESADGPRPTPDQP